MVISDPKPSLTDLTRAYANVFWKPRADVRPAGLNLFHPRFLSNSRAPKASPSVGHPTRFKRRKRVHCLSNKIWLTNSRSEFVWLLTRIQRLRKIWLLRNTEELEKMGWTRRSVGRGGRRMRKCFEGHWGESFLSWFGAEGRRNLTSWNLAV